MSERSSSPDEAEAPVTLRSRDVQKLKDTVETFQSVLGSISTPLTQDSDLSLPGSSGLCAHHLTPLRERKKGEFSTVIEILNVATVCARSEHAR